MKDYGTQNFIRAVGYLDEKWLLEHREYEKKLRRRARTLRTVAASCACLVLCVAILLPVLHGLRPDDGLTDDPTDGPIYNGGVTDDPPEDSTPPEDDVIIGTRPSYYFDIFQQAADAPLPEGNFPQESFLAWYADYMGTPPDSIPISEAEAHELMTRITPKLSEALNTPIPPYSISKKTTDDGLTYLESSLTYTSEGFSEREWFSYFQSDKIVSCSLLMPNATIFEIDGQIVEIDPANSDEEMAKSIQQARHRLCEIFDTDLKDIRIQRWISKIFPSFISIYLYNQDDHPLGKEDIVNSPGPLSEYIYLEFRNTAQNSSDNASSDAYHLTSIKYNKSHLLSQGVFYSPMEPLPVLPMEEAAALLKSLCCCEHCSHGIDVSEYDAVGFHYVWTGASPYIDDDKKFSSVIIPCYAFYKAIDPPLYYECKPGNQMYCVSYIPAIAFEGMQEYFEAQAKSHKFLPPETDPAE